MSYDGSSAKSYIRHATEKERLDNLAFASFPEDYLPYAAGHSRPPPPYLLWGDDRRRRPPKKRRRPRCAGALLCAIALVVVAILAVVAISVYLGVVTNLFRSPVVSVSGRFTADEEEFTPDLLNSSSSKFLEKADLYKSKVEKAFYSSSLEPAFIAARIYSFRPGLVVFFRVYLDRRKLRDDEQSPAPELVRHLVAQRLAAHPDSVHVEENEELLSLDPAGLSEVVVHPSPSSTTTTFTTKQPLPKAKKERPSPSEGVGEWRPVPIEDSVSPSFAERPPDGVGLLEGPPRRRPSDVLGVARDTPPAHHPPPARVQHPSGSVRLLQEPPPRNAAEGTGSVRLLEEISPRNPPPGGLDEGIGTVRVLEKGPPKAPRLTESLGTGSVSLLDDALDRAPLLPVEGVGSVRLMDESPKKVVPSNTRLTGVASVRELDDKKSPPFENQGSGLVRSREPPTLAPSVSLVVRKPSRSDGPGNSPTRLAKIRQNVDSAEGVGSVREVVAEVDLPPIFQGRPPGLVASKFRDLESGGTSTAVQDVTDHRTDETSSEEGAVTENHATEASTMIRDSGESEPAETEDSDPSPEGSLSESVEDLIESDKPSLEADAEIESRTNSTEASSIYQESSEQDKSEDLNESFEAEIESREDLLESDKTDAEIESRTYSTEASFTIQDNSETEDSNRSLSESEEYTTSLLERTFEPLTTQSLSSALDPKITTLENILFNHASPSSSQQTPSASPRNVTEEDSVTEMSLEVDDPTTETREESAEDDDFSGADKETTEMPTSTTDQDIHSSIINYSQYLFDEPHYHAISKEHAGNASVQDVFDVHTLEGHGFHQPPSTTPEPNATTSLEASTATADAKPPSDPDFLEYSFNKTGNGSSDYEGWSAEEEGEGVPDPSQQAKIVPQLQSDLLSNAIGEEDVSVEGEILRHVTTVGPKTNDSLDECPPGSVSCGDAHAQCGVRCDLRRDCPNNADENGCTCSELLRAMGQSQKMCDGVDDCDDGSDEAGCPWCGSVDEFVCAGSRACVPLDRVCDGKDDCPAGQDEKRCVSLASSSSEAAVSEYRPEGYLIVRKQGRWGKLCLDTLPSSPETDRRIADLGRAVCSALTYRNMSSSIRSIDESGTGDSFYQILTDAANSRSSAVASIFESTSCEEKRVLKVKCASLECGLRPSASSQRRRIVGGRSAEGAGAWPWSAALYREGEFQCGAALISDTWLLSAAHCFYSSPHAHWTARLGVLRRGSELPSGGEQVRRIAHIVLHPQYEDVGFINDIALLRMDRPIPFSDSLRPICLPSSPKEDATLWHGQRCSVVGWGKLYEIGHTFPDSLQEVRLPVISSSECQKRSIFLPAYRITNRMFCAGYDRGGRDACLGDSGGPMACQRPADGRWIILGVTSNGDGCGRPGRPGVYSQVSGFLTWIQETMIKEVSGGATGSESSCHQGGVRCRLGRCVPSSRVCDGRRDCAGGEDEEGC